MSINIEKRMLKANQCEIEEVQVDIKRTFIFIIHKFT